jgi:hypothetical protein
MLDGIDNVWKNTLNYDKAEWLLSSVAGTSTAIVKLDAATAGFIISSVTVQLRSEFTALGGEFPE